MINRITTHEYARVQIYLYNKTSHPFPPTCVHHHHNPGIICPYSNGFKVDDDIFIFHIDSGKIFSMLAVPVYFTLVFPRSILGDVVVVLNFTPKIILPC